MNASRKSPAQRKAERVARRVGLGRLGGRPPVDPARLGANCSYGLPEFVQRGYYLDQPFNCRDCGRAEVWTSFQQQWWFEVARGDMWTRAISCRPCRRQERERRTEARRVHLEGVAAKAAQA